LLANTVITNMLDQDNKDTYQFEAEIVPQDDDPKLLKGTTIKMNHELDAQDITGPNQFKKLQYKHFSPTSVRINKVLKP